jgi:hypothetical protein
MRLLFLLLVIDDVLRPQPSGRPCFELALRPRREYPRLLHVAAIIVHVGGGKFGVRHISGLPIRPGKRFIGCRIFLVAGNCGVQLPLRRVRLAGQQQRLPIAGLDKRRFLRVESAALLSLINVSPRSSYK